MAQGETAPRDENQVTALLGTDSTTGNTTVKIYANPTTHRLLVEDTSGGVVGPGSSTDNAVARWDGTTGETLQNSVVIVGDTGNVTGVATFTATGLVTASGYKAGASTGTSGTFTTVDLKTVTVVNGIITSIA